MKKDGSKNRRRSQTQESECEKRKERVAPKFQRICRRKKKTLVISELCCEMMSEMIKSMKAGRFVVVEYGARGGKRKTSKSSLPRRCDGHTEQKKAVQQLAPPPNDQSSGGLTQSGWCEEAGENKQACGPHGLLF